MTIRAAQVLEECSVIAGYTVYIDLIKEHFPGREFLTTPMRQEKERCLMALETASRGKVTAMICSGDSGVYGMAGLILLLAAGFPDVDGGGDTRRYGGSERRGRSGSASGP